MITKMTILAPNLISAEFNRYKNRSQLDQLQVILPDVAKLADHYSKADSLFRYLLLHPEAEVLPFMKVCFQSENVTVKNYTKTRRTYRYWLTVITEEDVTYTETEVHEIPVLIPNNA